MLGHHGLKGYKENVHGPEPTLKRPTININIKLILRKVVSIVFGKNMWRQSNGFLKGFLLFKLSHF